MKRIGKRVFFIACLTVFLQAQTAQSKKRYKKRKWSVSITNGYTFYDRHEKNSALNASTDLSGHEGQMNRFFSALEISRNFGYYEWGGKLQLFDYGFASPFLKINFRKNRRRAAWIPSLTLGVVPSFLFGGYARLALDLFPHPYWSLRPFVGIYSWKRIKIYEHYIKNNIHLNGGVSLTVHF